jgi:hypothetical protein
MHGMVERSLVHAPADRARGGISSLGQAKSGSTMLCCLGEAIR